MQIQAVRFGFWGKKKVPTPEEKKPAQTEERKPPRPGLVWNEKKQKWQDPETGGYYTEINDVPF